MNNKKQKGHKLTATYEVLEAKTGIPQWSFHKAPPRGWGNHLNHPSRLTHQSACILTPFQQPALPPSRASKRTCYLFLFPHAKAWVPIKASPNSSPGLYQFLLIEEPKDPNLYPLHTIISSFKPSSNLNSTSNCIFTAHTNPSCSISLVILIWEAGYLVDSSRRAPETLQ